MKWQGLIRGTVVVALAAAALAVPSTASAAVAWQSEQVLALERSGDGTGIEDVAIGDVTGDSRDDIVALAPNAAAGLKDIVVFPGTGTDSLGAPVTTAIAGDVTFSPRSVAIENLNGDAAMDIVVGTVGVVSNTASGHLITMLADGSGGFSGQTDLLTGPIPNQVQFLNANGDAMPDIVIGGAVGVVGPPPGIYQDVKIGINDGAGNFAFPDALAFDVGDNKVRNSLSVGDLNGGADDIVFANGNEVGALLSGPGGSYSFSAIPAAANVCATAIGDFNADGVGDVFDGVCTPEPFTGRAEVFAGSTGGSFTPLAPVFADGDVRDAVVGDFDLVADGRQDLMVTNIGIRDDFPNDGRFPSLVNWIRNTPGGLEVRPMTERRVPADAAQAGAGGSIAAGQLNADGVPDLAVESYDGLVVFRSFDDIVPPDTEIVGEGGAGGSNAATGRAPLRAKSFRVRFASSEAGAAFVCKLDKRKAKPCRSPYRFSLRGLKAGRHVLTIRATDLAGNRERKPARVRFKVRG